MALIKSGSETIASIAGTTDTILLAFSCGKDSIAAWLECRKHFKRIIPYYMYLVPDLEFVDNSLAYYEQWFGCRIMRVPHPSLYRMLAHCVFTPPERRGVIVAARLPLPTYAEIQSFIREDLDLPQSVYTASGVRAVDSPARMIALRSRGSINHGKKQFFPIWDWNKAKLVAEIKGSGVKLPVVYTLFGRSFDGVDYRFLAPLAERFPADYRRILDWFPLAEAELWRRQYAA